MKLRAFVFSLLSIFAWSLCAGEYTIAQEGLQSSGPIVTSQNQPSDAEKRARIAILMLDGAVWPNGLLGENDLDYIISFLTLNKSIIDVDLETCSQACLELQKQLSSHHKAFLLKVCDCISNLMGSRFNRRDLFKSVAITKNNVRMVEAIKADEQKEELNTIVALSGLLALWLAAIKYAPASTGTGIAICVPCIPIGVSIAKTCGWLANGKWEQTMGADVKKIQRDLSEIRGLIASLEISSGLKTGGTARF